MLSFRLVHHELLTAAEPCSSKVFTLLGREKRVDVPLDPPGRTWKRTHLRPDPGWSIIVSLDWKADLDILNQGRYEELYWTLGPQKIVCRPAIDRYGRTIIRYKTMEAWKKRVSIQGRVCCRESNLDDFEEACTVVFTDSLLDKVLATAPQGVNREEAKKHYCEAFRFGGTGQIQ